MRDAHRMKDKLDLSLDSRQIVSLLVAGMVVVGAVFVLGVVVGKKLSEADRAAQSRDLLTALDEKAAALRQAVDALPEIGEIVLKAFLTRRTLLLSDGFEGIKIIGSRFSPDAHRLRDFATRNAIPFTWLALESDEQAETLLRQFGVPPSATPVVIGR